MLSGEPLFPGDSDIDQIHLVTKCMGPLIDKHQAIMENNPMFLGLKLTQPVTHPLKKRFPTWSSLPLSFCKVRSQNVNYIFFVTLAADYLGSCFYSCAWTWIPGNDRSAKRCCWTSTFRGTTLLTSSCRNFECGSARNLDKILCWRKSTIRPARVINQLAVRCHLSGWEVVMAHSTGLWVIISFTQTVSVL